MKASVKPKKTGVKPRKRTYTEAELMQAIKYACEYQKACDYQIAGKLLIVDKSELQANSVLLLNELTSDKNAFSEIELKDIFK